MIVGRDSPHLGPDRWEAAFAALDVSHTGSINASDVMACAAGLGVKGAASLLHAAQSGQLWWTPGFWTGAVSAKVGDVSEDDNAPLLAGESRL